MGLSHSLDDGLVVVIFGGLKLGHYSDGVQCLSVMIYVCGNSQHQLIVLVS